MSQSKEAKEIASGGGIVFGASILDRGLRLVVTWLLSGYFGPEVFGIYTIVITIMTLVKMFSPLGTELGTVYFGARHRKNADRAKLKGLIVSSMGLSVASSIMCMAMLWVAAPAVTDHVSELRVIATALLFWTPLHTIVGLLRAQKDMKGNALVYQITMPLVLVAGAASVVWFEWSLTTALITYVISTAVPLLYGVKRAWKHFGDLFTDPDLPAVTDLSALLGYSIPMAFSQFVFRLNAWMDLLMLEWLTQNSSEVGIYRIAVSIAMISTLPINAIITIFNPIIVELVQSKNFERLNGLLKLVTKWLLLFNLPLLMLFYMLPDVVLAFFDDAYAPSQHPLIILVGGQLIWSACSIAMRIVPMSGYAMLNLANGVVAAIVNMGLNYWLIPKYGNIGAAMATSITLIVWSMWRLVEVKWLIKCFPFHKINLLLIGGAVLFSTTIKLSIQDSSLWIRLPVTGLLIIGFIGLAFWLGREPEDDDILDTVQRKVRRLMGKTS